MFCFLIKRKLYEFLEGNLNSTEAEKIKTHLARCAKCAQEYSRMRQVLALASQKKTPELSSQFWANFDQELEEKLDKRKALPQEIKLRPYYLPRFSLKPAFAVATVFVLLMAISFYLFGGLPTKARLTALSDERLVNDIEILEELIGESVVLDNEDYLLNELNLLDELS